MMLFRTFFIIAVAGLLGACATLPNSGPTGQQVISESSQSEPSAAIAVVEVDRATALPAPAVSAAVALAEMAPPPTDTLGPGDVLEISIYEAGVSLFGGGQTMIATPSFDPSAKAHTLPPIRVDDAGDIIIPYVGRLHVAGGTIGEAQDLIRRALRGLTQDPQVVVTRRDVITNSVIVSGEVARPGRLVLQTNRERLSDVVALAGGYRGKASELAVRVSRGQQSVELRLSELLENPALDVPAIPGDRVALIYYPRTFSVLGASGRVDQVPFSRSTISLAEAVATAGGVNPNLGDPAAVFVFRYVADETADARPVVYHLNMMRTGSYFLAQRFEMHDKDILYVGNARANQPSKLIQLISQLFSPILTVTSAVQTVRLSR